MNPHSYLIALAQKNNSHNEIVDKLLPIKNGLSASVSTLNNGRKKIKVGNFISFEDNISDDKEAILQALFNYFCFKLEKENQFNDYEKNFKPSFSVTRKGRLAH